MNQPQDSNERSDWTVLLLALMMFIAPAIGVPSEEMLQDTLKSIVISFGTLMACFMFFWQWKNQDTKLLWHPLVWLPLGLAVYAVGSMAWSHAFLAGVEAVRWFVFSLLLWLGINSLTYERVPRLALGIHLGATLASVWTALQFWIDFKYFPQGPNPASTFVNRNFFAEFLVCTLPFSIFLLTRQRKSPWILALTLSLAFNLTALLMTGARSALIGTMLLLAIVPVILFLYWDQLEASSWSIRKCVGVAALLVFSVLGLGSIPTNNAQLITEYGGGTGIDRAFSRTLSITKASEYTQGSFSIRAVMWKATGRMIAARPLGGVGAGAWEVDAPLYQNPGTQLETDFYAHNEILQLLAEYGLLGWVFLACLLGYLVLAALRTWTNRSSEGRREAPLRALTLASLLVLLLVSNAGFPWRLAGTGALFAISLSILAASDARLNRQVFPRSMALGWERQNSKLMLGMSAFLLAVALYVAEQAMASESKLVRAIKIALTISKSGEPSNPQWDKAKAEMLALMEQGIRINPHYRKLTPMAADELASWGDWTNAIWIYESVLASRPNVVAIAANISRGYMQLGDYQKSMEYLSRARKLQPTAPAVRSVEVILLTRMGEHAQAARIVRELFAANTVDYDLVYSAYLIGIRSQDWKLAIQALMLRIDKWPSEAADGWLKLGDIYNRAEVKDEAKALESYQAALKAAPVQAKEAVWAKVPPAYKAQLPGPATP